MADGGDLQSAVSMYIVLGDRVKGLMLDPDTVLAWFQGYIDLLQSFRLFNVATCVCKRVGSWDWKNNSGGQEFVSKKQKKAK